MGDATEQWSYKIGSYQNYDGLKPVFTNSLLHKAKVTHLFDFLRFFEQRGAHASLK